MSFELPELPYAYNALEPHIDAKTMEIHHSKHHQAYTNKLNDALSGHEEADGMPAEAIIMDLESLPEDIQGPVRNNGGGYVNHSLFWEVMSPDGGGEPGGELGSAIGKSFGSFGDFKEEFAAAAATRFGSGWAWLVVTPGGDLAVGSTANQDSPLMGDDIAGLAGTPILGLDVWEHAYYLNYQNKRPDYITAWWNVVNWQHVAEKYSEAI